jgi:hypothetical protein
MIEFYRALGQGQTAAAALRLAKLHFLSGSGPFRSPYYWAAFIVEGDGSWHRRAIPAARPYLLISAMGVVVALALAFIVRGRLARRRS